MSFTIRMWDISDLCDEALNIGPDLHPCGQGPWCPRCLLALAKGRLDVIFKVGITQGDDMLAIASHMVGPFKVWTKEESHQKLREIRLESMRQDVTLLTAKVRYIAAHAKVRQAEDDLAGWKSELWEAERELTRAAKDAGLKAGARLDDKADPVTIKLDDKWAAKWRPEDWGKVLKWAEAYLSGAIYRKLNVDEILKHIDAGHALPEYLSVEAFTGLTVRRKPRRNEQWQREQTKEETPW